MAETAVLEAGRPQVFKLCWPHKSSVHPYDGGCIATGCLQICDWAGRQELLTCAELLVRSLKWHCRLHPGLAVTAAEPSLNRPGDIHLLQTLECVYF